MIVKTVSTMQVRAQLGEILNEAKYGRKYIVIERQGKPMAALVNIEELENILETLAELSNSAYLRSIKEARDDYKKGRVYTMEEMEKIVR
jgi:prevent-host-death family protein